MELIWKLGIEITKLVQSAGDRLLPFMKVASFLGSEELYIVILASFYWSINSSVGLRLGVTLLLSDAVNTFFKLFFHHPRPYWYDSSVSAYSTENSFGMPSGHAQNAVAIWGTLAVVSNSRLFRLAVIAVIILISFSRLYLGVHFFNDVLLGWILGIAVLYAVAALTGPVSEKLKGMSLKSHLLTALLVSVAAFFIQMAPLLMHEGWIFPSAWMTNIAAAAPGTLMPDPRRIAGTISVSGALLGYGTGLALIYNYGGFSTKGPLRNRLMRLAAGFAGIIIIYIGLKVIMPHGDSVFAYVCRFARYMLTGLWIMAGAPYIFTKTGIGSKAVH